MGAFARALSWIMRLAIIGIAMLKLSEGDYFALMLYMFAFFVSLLPLIVNAVYNVRLHWIFELTFSFALLWHMVGFLGAYDALSLWDDFGHMFGGALLALIGFAWLYSMDISRKIKLTLPMIGFISVTWSVTAGVAWEFLEFFWDSLHGLVNVYGLAQNGLIDTMTDLSFDLIAAVCMVLICIYIVNKMKEQTRDRIINPFVEIIEKKHSP